MTYLDNKSPEQKAVLTATGVTLERDPAHNRIHVFHIGGATGIIGHKVILPDGKWRGWGNGWAAGIAHPWFNSCWVNNGDLASWEGTRSLLDVIAHEIGHVLIGIGHAENDPNYKIPLYSDKEFQPYKDYKFFLPNASPLPRLMVGGPRYNPKITARTLIEGEWTAIQEWGNSHMPLP